MNPQTGLRNKSFMGEKKQDAYLKTKSTLPFHDDSCETGSQYTTNKSWKLLRNNRKSSPADLGSVD